LIFAPRPTLIAIAQFTPSFYCLFLALPPTGVRPPVRDLVRVFSRRLCLVSRASFLYAGRRSIGGGW